MAGRISEMTTAGSLTGTELLEVTQSGNTRKTTAAEIAALAGATVSIVNDTAMTRTLQISDPGKVIRRGNAGEMNDVVPLNSGVAFPVGSMITVRQTATGQVVMTPASGVTLNIPTGRIAATRAQWSTLTLHKVGTNEWDVAGDLANTP